MTDPSNTGDKRNILIVDDNDSIRSELHDYLTRRGYQASAAASAEEAQRLFAETEEPFDVAVVDVIMPGESGLDLTRWITANTQTAVILLTELDDVSDRITGLESGADDYVPKPFSMGELVARIRSVLRRQERPQADADEELAEKPSGEVVFSGWHLDLNYPTLTRSKDGDSIHLAESEYLLLKALSAHLGEPVSREALTQEVFNREWQPNDRAIDNLVVKLRKVLETTPEQPMILRTVRNRGYVLS